ncbi:uncharacterized protein LOC106156118 [Lingula anatina]|uniref:Uncharacterized protein LOC106156118 n=1 Tax=Lingula anatina TaxID=7574 RepID=A0A1S3HKQ4_LINAN|nr:uncharacterized protein LOC106156118 [Lingula anatina]|eukprot:XP_013386683.1 uncharacterized protein LOC106156118 [Lingula anatina]
MERTKLQVICVVLVATFSLSAGLTCISCSSTFSTNSACQEQPTANTTTNCTTGFCKKIFVETDTLGIKTKSWTRECGSSGASAGCTTGSVLGVTTTTCHCSTDNCNGATSTSPLATVLLAVSAFVPVILQYGLH